MASISFTRRRNGVRFSGRGPWWLEQKVSGLSVTQSKWDRYPSTTPSMQRSTVAVQLFHTELAASSNLAAATWNTLFTSLREQAWVG
jgi:hypothetical protein